jgi:hypothetical protein
MFLHSFALMQKNQKIKAVAYLAKNRFRFAKMPKTRCAQTVGIF